MRVNLVKVWFCLGVLSGAVSAQDEIKFDTLDVSASSISNEEKPFVTPGAVSVREGLLDATQSIDSVVRSIPGAYTQTDQSQGSVSVNIRGMSGFGRVNTMVDGVPQTFFGTSADQGKFHTGNGSVGTSAFGATIDQNFLVGVEVERGTMHGANGSNALMGSANFKTIGVADVIKQGSSVGAMGKYSYGTNGIGPSYMGAVGVVTTPHGDDSMLGVIFGYSGKKISQNYKVGGGKKIGDDSVINGDGEEVGAEAFNPNSLTQRPKSTLFKIEYNPDSDNFMIISHRNYQNTLAGRKIDTNSYQYEYRYNPQNDLIDTKMLIAYTQGRQKYNQDATIFGRSDLAKDGLKAKNSSLNFDISNTIKAQVGSNLDTSHTLGFSYFTNRYKSGIKSDADGAGAIPFQPSGKQEITSVYLDSEFNYDIFTLGTNLNLAHWELSGHKPECGDNPNCFPKAATDIKKSGEYLNGSIILSAKIHDYFQPFVSYSKTTRAPNVQEMFFSSDHGDSVNPFLKPENATTYQVGFNGFGHGVITPQDRLGFKVLYYKTDVKDYIYNRRFPIGESFYLHVNSEQKSKFDGVEAQMSYDAGFMFTKLSYARQNSVQPISETYSSNAGSFGFSRISELPKDYATFELGARLFDEKFVIGAIAKYTGKAKRVNPDNSVRDGDGALDPLSTQPLPNIPTIYDLYASYNISDSFSVRAEVQNLTDKNYMDALNTYNSQESQVTYNSNYDNVYLFNNSSRGRTFLVSFQYKY